MEREAFSHSPEYKEGEVKGVSAVWWLFEHTQRASTISHLQSLFYFIRRIQVMSEVQGKRGFSQVLLFFTFVFVCAGFQRPMNDQSMRTCPQSSALRPDSLQC